VLRHGRGPDAYNPDVARRHPAPDPELAALARDRLARLLGAEVLGPRRAAAEPDDAADGGGVRGSLADDVAPSGCSRPVDRDDLEPPRRFTRLHLGVVAVVLVVGLAWGGWSWVRARPEAVAAPAGVPAAAGAPPGAGPTGAPAPAGSATAPAEPGQTGSEPSAAPAGPVVHVLGAVRRPGLVRLSPGARVEDALDAAGGLRRDADPGELNLAQPLEDGVQVLVGTRAHPEGEVRTGSAGSGGAGAGEGGGARAGSASGSSSGGTVDLNRATVDQLDTLPGVGPVTAQRILEWREQHGRFSRVDELQEVDGIGPKTYARLQPLVRV
jgi:competence protein ComEA